MLDIISENAINRDQFRYSLLIGSFNVALHWLDKPSDLSAQFVMVLPNMHKQLIIITTFFNFLTSKYNNPHTILCSQMFSYCNYAKFKSYVGIIK